MAENRTLFLDRDGIINRRIVDGYVTSIEQFEFKNDFLETMGRLSRSFKKIFVITNQQGVGKGIMTMAQVDAVHEYMCRELSARGIEITGVYVCPHLATEGCRCRKPRTGLAEQAKLDNPEIDFTNSVMIGDSLSDILFGRACGMKTVFVNDSNIALTPDLLSSADIIVDSFAQLAAYNF